MADEYSTPRSSTSTAVIAWHQLHLQHRLGEGASGVIQQASWRGRHSVAVKLYKGDITSDGTPASEMNACMAAGNHPGLIEVEGRISDHPQGLPGLVMKLIDPLFANLAGPPSLDSCTRDVYAPGTRFSQPTLLRLAQGIASVAAHLHARGILHGDLYAHNILCDSQGNGLLGDFGAASFYPPDASPAARRLQRIEVRAFGVLLAELLDRCDTGCEALQSLQRDCMRADILARPSFAEVNQRLAAVPVA